MSHHREIGREGQEAYLASRMAEAAMLYRRAASASLEVGDCAAWFEFMVRAADASLEKGDALTSLALLLEARAAEPEDAEDFSRWWSRVKLLELTESLRPAWGRLQQLFADLGSYASIHTVPAGDLPEHEGDLLRLRGDWSAALGRYEAAWQAFDGRGGIRAGKAYAAAHCCLQLGRLAGCRDWISAIDQSREENKTHFWSAELSLLVGLAEGEPFVTLYPKLGRYTDRAADLQRYDVDDSVRVLVARVHLLDPCAGDPAANLHPARAELRRPPRNRQNVQCRYLAHLVHLDYCIGCLRHAAGIPAVDDLYYRHVQQIPARMRPADRDQFQRRLHRVRAAARGTLRYARHLDALLECDYRQREVRSRTERIEEMGLAVF
jgi:hypothetical protein